MIAEWLRTVTARHMIITGLALMVIMGGGAFWHHMARRADAHHRAIDRQPSANPVVRDGILLGGVLAGRVVGDEAMAPHVAGGETYRCFTQSGPSGTATGGPAQSTTPIAVDLSGIDVSRVDIALCGAWNPLPRLPQVVKPFPAADRASVAACLRAHGIAHPHVRLTADLSIDLEGDGSPERVLCATTQTPNYVPGPLGMTSVRPGDYSLVLVTTSRRGIATPILVTGVFFPTVGENPVAVEFTLAGVYDVDGDGVMEVLISSRSSEEISATTVYRITGTRATETGMGCIWPG